MFRRLLPATLTLTILLLAGPFVSCLAEEPSPGKPIVLPMGPLRGPFVSDQDEVPSLTALKILGIDPDVAKPPFGLLTPGPGPFRLFPEVVGWFGGMGFGRKSPNGVFLAYLTCPRLEELQFPSSMILGFDVGLIKNADETALVTPTQFQSRTLEDLLHTYREALAAGRYGEASIIGQAALLLDPTCFSSRANGQFWDYFTRLREVENRRYWGWGYMN